MKLHAFRGWGSALVEAQLAWYGLPFELVEAGDLLEDAEAAARLRRQNPAMQVPTLELGTGEVLTESAAITLWLADLAGSVDLVPPPGSPERAQFLRWLIFLVAAIYPCFTFGDVPARFVADEAARQPFRDAVDARLNELWLAVEAAAGSPWFLGHRMSAIDIYFGVMTRWRPRGGWFDNNAPKVLASGNAARRHPRMAAVFARNRFDPATGG